MWVREHIQVVGKTMSSPSCLPSLPLLALFFLVVECSWHILTISFSVFKLNSSRILLVSLVGNSRGKQKGKSVHKMILVSCLSSCHNLSRLLAGSGCLLCFDLAPRHFPDLKPGSVNACHLTRHEADKWDSSRFTAWRWC